MQGEPASPSGTGGGARTDGRVTVVFRIEAETDSQIIPAGGEDLVSNRSATSGESCAEAPVAHREG